jgi:threonine synthase
MRFESIQNPGRTVSFRDAVDRGIAEDGSLYMPVNIPRLPKEFFASLHAMTFQEIALRIAGILLDDEIPEKELRQIVERSMTFPVPVRNLDGNTSVLELFHGPTLAFKDFGAQFMAQAMAYVHRNETEERTILVATSGDTGSAVAHGFHNVQGMSVCLLYPSHRVSAIQEMQLTTLAGNVTALEVAGSFDDCQRLVKEAFADKELSMKKKLTSANSINVARLLPQTFYYFSSYGQRVDQNRPTIISVPSGNLGNVTAGLIAWKMGLPVDRFIAATNLNDVFPRFVKSGVFTPAQSIATISNAMDVGNPSNFGRIMHLFHGNVTELRQILSSAAYSDANTRATILEYYEKYQYVLDPHGAVAALALERYRNDEKQKVNGIIVETAHPSKFIDVYEEPMKAVIEVPERLRVMMRGTKHSIQLSATLKEFKSFLMST